MVRIKTSVASHRRKKRVLKRAKGQFGHRSTRYQQAQRSVIKGLRFQYRDRKVKTREFKQLWITRINAACRAEGIMYSRFIQGLGKAKVNIDRKMLSDLAVQSPDVFQLLVTLSKTAVIK